MEVIVIIVALIIVFALGPVIAMLDFLTIEMSREAGPGVGLGRLLLSLVLLWLPFAWIVYFVVIRRRPPFA